MFYAEEHVVVGLVGQLIIDFGLGVVEVDSGIFQIIVLQSHRIEDGLVQPRVDVSLAE